MKLCITKFEEFYKNKHQNRNLTWLYQHGSVEVNPLYTNKKYTFVVNAYQGVILCLFNKYSVLTYNEIKDHTKINDSELT